MGISLSQQALEVLDEVLSKELRNFTDYIADPMMEGQEWLTVAQGEVDRLQPVLEELRAARGTPQLDGWLWRPSATSNKRNFTNDLSRRPYPDEGLFVPVAFTGPEITWEALRKERWL